MRKKKKRFSPTVLIVAVMFLAAASWGWSVWVRIHDDPPPPPVTSEDPPPEVVDVPDKNILNVLILGIDQLEREAARADSIMVMSFNQDTGEVALISIPRDSRVEIPGRSGLDKINHAMAYRGEIALMKQTVEKLLGVPMHHYVYTNFAGFTRIVDILDGVTIDVERRMEYPEANNPIDLYPGVQRLNGTQALGYVRYRSDSNGDFARMQRQQKFLKAVAEEVLKPSIVFKVPQLLEHAARHVRTDMAISQLLSFSKTAMQINLDEIETVLLQGSTVNINGVSYVQLDEDFLRETIRLYLRWEEM
ncbi:MAG: LCP family protein [Dethiobacter sp.]|jgi:LCP family protein required for cell wall assembly|nr:LCP family protein [Dethiobacter sp.]